MCKSPLQGDMSNVEYAATLSREMTQHEARGPGDMENAWRRFEQRYAIPWRIFWALRYRKPKEIADEIYTRLQAAYFHECERQKRKLEAQLEKTKLARGPDHPLVVSTETLLGREEETQGDASGLPPERDS